VTLTLNWALFAMRRAECRLQYVGMDYMTSLHQLSTDTATSNTTLNLSTIHRCSRPTLQSPRGRKMVVTVVVVVVQFKN